MSDLLTLPVHFPIIEIPCRGVRKVCLLCTLAASSTSFSAFPPPFGLIGLAQQ